MALLARLTRRAPAQAPRRPPPPPGVLRRERRALLKLRDDRFRDLGGLIFEMYRRDRFREDLVLERCSELLELDARLHELESLLSFVRHRAPLTRCTCGAALAHGAHFCTNCGRPAGERAVVACPACGHALAADAKFCASCGAAADGTAAVDGVAPEAREEAAEAAAAPDGWER
jgi:predicted amidophosphoribosyltransferase